MSEYIIGSFNVCKMSYRSDQEIKKNYAHLARIICAERFDIVALQEVFSENPLKTHLMPALGKQWSYVFASPTPYSAASAEGYAFLYRKQRLQLVDTNSNPEIYTKYHIGSGIVGITGSKHLIRPPFVARFTPQGTIGGSNFEFRLINTHIAFSTPSGAAGEIADIKLRKDELQILAKEIYRRYSTQRYGNNLPAYTVLLGDYNLCLTGEGPKIDKITQISENRTLLHVQSELTSLCTANSANQTSVYYVHNYDHFSYDASYSEKMRLTDSRVEALGKYYGNDLINYRREISDHVPIKLTINLRMH